MLDKINDLYRGRQNLVFMRNNRFGAKHFSKQNATKTQTGFELSNDENEHFVMATFELKRRFDRTSQKRRRRWLLKNNSRINCCCPFWANFKNGINSLWSFSKKRTSFRDLNCFSGHWFGATHKVIGNGLEMKCTCLPHGARAEPKLSPSRAWAYRSS